MDEHFTAHASSGVAVTGDAIVAVGPEAMTYESADDHRLRRPRRHARPDQRAHPRADDAVARARRRPAPRRLADGLHDAGRTRVRQPRFREARHAAGVRRDDPIRRDLLRRHVLLRRRDRGGDRRRRDARAVRADGASLSDARRDQLRGFAGPCARVHRTVAGPSADRAGAGAARALHLHAGNPARLRRARGRVRRAAAHPPVRNGVRGRRARGGDTACRSCRG